jgi:hypothetical protein
MTQVAGKDQVAHNNVNKKQTKKATAKKQNV